MAKKAATFTSILRAVERARKAGKVIVATNGCFDILHVGHIRNLAAAKALGDVLVVGINSDASVRRSKGKTRPIISARERAELVAALKSVDHAFVFSADTPNSWIQKLRPHIHVKGGGADIRNHPNIKQQEAIIKRGGGKLVLVPHHAGKSTSAIVHKIKSL